MVETLQIKNFGPLKDVHFELKKIMVFIGPQSSGKSAISKLITVLRSYSLIATHKPFDELLKPYNIDTFIESNTYIRYSSFSYEFTYTDGKYSIGVVKGHRLPKLLAAFNEFEEKNKLPPIEIHSNILTKKMDEIERLQKESKSESNESLRFQMINKTNELLKELNEDLIRSDYRIKLGASIGNELLYFTNFSKYIPAERIIAIHIVSSLATLIANDVPIQKNLIEFISEYEKARNNINKLKIDMLDVTYSFEDNIDSLTLNDGKKIKLINSSSGTQALLPLLLIIEHYSTNTDKGLMYVIEEPVRNLFPIAQKNLTYYLIEKCLFKAGEEVNNEVIITTHSPYILSSINNLLYAGKLGVAMPHRVSKIINKNHWINHTDFAAYYLDKGKIRDILDAQTNLISENELDSASEDISYDFDRLIALEMEHKKSALNGATDKKKTAKLHNK